MKCTSLAALFLLGAVAAMATPVGSQAGSVAKEEARAIGVDAYLYFYPLITMDVTPANRPIPHRARSSPKGR
jgi:hypothetical protein